MTTSDLRYGPANSVGLTSDILPTVWLAPKPRTEPGPVGGNLLAALVGFLSGPVLLMNFTHHRAAVLTWALGWLVAPLVARRPVLTASYVCGLMAAVAAGVALLVFAAATGGLNVGGP